MDSSLHEDAVPQENREHWLKGLDHIVTFIKSELNAGAWSRGIAQRIRVQDTDMHAAAQLLTTCYQASPEDTLNMLLAIDAIARDEETAYNLTSTQMEALRRAVFTPVDHDSQTPAPFGTGNNQSHAQTMAAAERSGSHRWSRRDMLKMLKGAGSAAVAGSVLAGVPATYQASHDLSSPEPRHARFSSLPSDYLSQHQSALIGALAAAGIVGTLSGALAAAAYADKKEETFRSVRDETYNILRPLQTIIDSERAKYAPPHELQR